MGIFDRLLGRNKVPEWARMMSAEEFQKFCAILREELGQHGLQLDPQHGVALAEGGTLHFRSPACSRMNRGKTSSGVISNSPSITMTPKSRRSRRTSIPRVRFYD